MSLSNLFLNLILFNRLGASLFGVYAFYILLFQFFNSFLISIIINPLQTIAPKKRLVVQRRILNCAMLNIIVCAHLIFPVLYITQKIDGFGKNIFVADKNLHLLLSFLVVAMLLYDGLRRCFLFQERYFVCLLMSIVGYSVPLCVIMFIQIDGASGLKQSVIIQTFLLFLASITFISLSGIRKEKFAHYSLLTKRFFTQSKWLIASALINWSSANYFLIAGQVLIGSQAVGIIRMLQSYMGLFNIFLMVIENYSARVLAQSSKQLNALRMQFRKQMKSGTVLFLSITVIYITVSPLILPVIFHEPQLISSEYIILFCIINIINFFIALLKILSRVKNKTQIIFISYIVSVVFSVLSAEYVVSTFNLVGIIYGLLATQLIVLAVFITRHFHERFK